MGLDMRFEFATSSRIIFGEGTVREVPFLASRMGRRPLIVTGRTAERAAFVVEGLRRQGSQTFSVSVSGEPTIESVTEGLRAAREHGCDLVIGMGGGSVVDSAKAIAALCSNPGDVLDYLEVVGKGMSLTDRPVPSIAIPTTAGTGAEATMNAVIGSPDQRVKVSLRNPMMFPDLAVVDPELTYSMPPALTASTGLDALTQLLEAFVSRNANPVTDALCREGLKRAARSIKRAYENGADGNARADMAMASLLSGITLANAKLGAVHGFAAAIGGMFPVPHGVVCARLLPHVVRVNVESAARQGLKTVLDRYGEIARIVTGRADAGAGEFIEWTVDLYRDVILPDLGRFGLSSEHFAEIVVRAKRASSMKGNPVELSEEELTEILRVGLE
jgi:alcohol dehydrogenase class IV